MKNTNLLIGKINSGKTRGVIFNEVKKAIDNNENLLILDNKEEYFKTFKGDLDNKGYTSLVFNLKNSYNSNSFNPLMLPYKYYKNGDKDKAVDIINKLALEIFKSDNSIDPFWENSAASYFTSLSLILFKEGKEEEINLGSIQTMISIGENKVEDVRIIEKYFSKLSVLDSIYITGSPIVYAPSETRGSIISVMKQNLNQFCMREQLLNNLLGDDIDLRNISSKTAIFIIGEETLNGLANILINQVFASTNDTQIQFKFILDNFSDMPVLLELNSMLEQKVNMIVSVREKEQLISKYGKFIESKFENVIESFSVEEFIPLGNNSYPVSKVNDVKYFNIEDFVK